MAGERTALYVEEMGLWVPECTDPLPPAPAPGFLSLPADATQRALTWGGHGGAADVDNVAPGATTQLCG